MAEKVNLDNAVDWNDYGVSVEGQPQVKIRGGQETPEWFDYEAYRKAQGKEGDWSAPEMKNPDTLTKIRSALARVKEAPEVLGYAAHKVADPMYANVDYMGQQVGDWAAKKINNIARTFDVSPEARQYGRFEEEEYDPEAVDVRFGRNAYKEGYDNLGDYLEAKDQEKVDRYRGYNHANRFAPIENADDKFYTLSDTQTMEDWQPETTSGKIAKGAIETAGNMLPENLKALMEEKGIEGGAKMLGALAPMYKRLKGDREFANGLREQAVNDMERGRMANANHHKLMADKADMDFFEDVDDLKNTIANRKKAESLLTPQKAEKIKRQMSKPDYEKFLDDLYESYNEGGGDITGDVEASINRAGIRAGARKDTAFRNPAVQKAYDKRYIRGKNGRELKRLYEARDDAFHKWSGAYGNDADREMYSQMIDEFNDQIRELEKTNTPKPLPNPAAQRAEALARNNEPIENLITPKISKYMEENFSPEESQRLMKSFNRIRQDRDNAQSGYELFGRKDYLQEANKLNDTLTEDGIMEMLERVKRYDNKLLSRQDELIGFLKQPVQDKNLSDIGLLLQENVSDDILNRFRRLPDEWQVHFSQQIMRGIRSGELKTNGDVLDYFKKIATEPLDI